MRRRARVLREAKTRTEKTDMGDEECVERSPEQSGYSEVIGERGEEGYVRPRITVVSEAETPKDGLWGLRDGSPERSGNP